MENFDLLNNDLQVSPNAQNFLNECARWGKFLSIVGFFFCVLMALLSFFVPALILNMPPYNTMPSNLMSGISAGITIIYLLLALLMFFPCLYLLRFSTKMQSAVEATSQDNFEQSLKNLKSLFRFCGIIVIVMLSIYLLIFIIAMLSTAIRG